MALGDRLFKGIAWSAIDRVVVQGVQFIIGIVLARILTPEEYGIIAILYVFIGLSQVFIDSGFSQALIQKKDRTQSDISTVFFFNFGISLICYLALWLAAPYIAIFYEIKEINILIRVLALTLIINSLYTVPATLFTIELDFRALSKINFISLFISGLAAIFLAWKGFGVWALVYQGILRSVLSVIVVWFLIKWKPLWVFSRESFQKLFSFGSKLLISSLLGTFFSHLNSLLIGKYIGAKDLGHFTRGIQFTDALFGFYSVILNNVLLPGLAPIQDQKELLVSYTKTIIRATTIIIAPSFLLLMVLAEPLVLFLLTDKWLKAVPIMQLFCVARMITIISGINVNLLYVLGRSDLALKQQYFKIIIRIALILIGLQFGIVYVALAELVSTMIHFFFDSYFPGKIMNYNGIKQLKDLTKILFSALVMAAIAYGITVYVESISLQLLVSPIIAILVYLGLIKLFRVEEMQLLFAKSKAFLDKKR